VTVGGPSVRIFGGHDHRTSFAVVNREWRAALERAGVRLVDDDTADVLIHHDYSVRFGEAALPAARKRVAVRPWDFGPYPRRWIDVVEQQYDELWVFTRWARECARRAGLAPERVRIVPHGVDPASFAPWGPPHPITTSHRCTFLFVGAAIDRKGIDVVLRAYSETFDANDDVQLVVKDHTSDVFYDGLTRRAEILALADRDDVATVRYLDEYLPRAELSALYRGATVLVHPARAEGWALPVLEAMACGTPVVVPRFGAFLDYCEEPAAVFTDGKRIRAPVGRNYAVNTLGFEERVDAIDFCEPVVASVAQALRTAAAWSDAELTARREAARAIAEQWSWDHAAQRMAEAVRDLIAAPQ
jgi:glycosyltransferase involved in cell wall biosynthesis